MFVTCPKCGFESDKNEKECVKCGIIFEKYKKHLKRKEEIEAIEKEKKEEWEDDIKEMADNILHRQNLINWWF